MEKKTETLINFFYTKMIHAFIDIVTTQVSTFVATL